VSRSSSIITDSVLTLQGESADRCRCRARTSAREVCCATTDVRERWAQEFSAAAAAHWTPERTRQLTGGKRLAVLPGEAPVLLRALGLLHRDATMPPTQVRKFLQINHVVRVLESSFDRLRAHHATLRVIDAGCGRSYLSLLLAWLAGERWRHPVTILGVDRDPAVIDECRRRASLAELDDAMTFRAARLDELGDVEAAHAVIALHACDTATDDAIALGAAMRSDLIAVAPCCQAELARAWTLRATGADTAFSPIHRAPHLRRELAAHLTDALRVLLLRGVGYAVTPLEFIAAAHTQKNTLLRALRTEPDPAARAEYDRLVAGTGGCGIALAARLLPLVA
jgi:SAM-dependent methyltransferase